MALFGGRRERRAASDEAWLGDGHTRYERKVPKYYGSPETLAAGGDESMSQGDVAAAIFFYAEAIDTAQTRWATETRELSDDLRLFTAYVDAVSAARTDHPDADLVNDSYNNGGVTRQI